MSAAPNRRIASIAVLVLVVGMILGGYAWQRLGPGSAAGGAPAASTSPTGTGAATASSTKGAPKAKPSGRTDPESGLRWIEAAELPAEARSTLQLIDSGGPYPYDKDGSTFGNFEGVLPKKPRGYYKEYTVKTPGERDRGARRIVTGNGDREFFWTADHYASFARVRR